MIIYLVHAQQKKVTREEFNGKVLYIPAGSSVFTESLIEKVKGFVKENPSATNNEIAIALANSTGFEYEDTVSQV